VNKFDGSVSEFVGAIGISQNNGRVGVMINKTRFSFVNLSSFLCANKLDRRFNPEVRVKARFERGGEVLRSWDMPMRVGDDRRSVFYDNFLGVGTWVREGRRADTLKVKIRDGCGESILMVFDLRGSESKLMGKFFPYKLEKFCAKLTRKVEKLESRGGNRYEKARRKQEESCGNLGNGRLK
jgi:hypothetical protein